MMEKKFDFQAPQFVESWREVFDEDEVEKFFRENDPQSTSSGLNQNIPRTPRNLQRPHSFSVVSRSGRRCHSSFRDSLFSREKEFFNKKILNFGKENETKVNFKAKPATVLKKEPYWPYRESRNFTEARAPVLKTEKRSLQRQVLKEIKKEREKLFEAETLQVIKEDEEELKKYRKTLEFKARPYKK